jgi:uncharacterized protein YndB with AHSA1/START domain
MHVEWYGRSAFALRAGDATVAIDRSGKSRRAPGRAGSGSTIRRSPACRITREFDAPLRLVYKAYTTPELVKRWWAGRRGETHSAEIDLRVGGAWRFAMVATGGHEVAFHGVYREILPDARLVHTEVFEGAPAGSGALVTVTFAEVAPGRTALTLLMELPSREVRDAILATGMESRLQESLEQLEQVAASLA